MKKTGAALLIFILLTSSAALCLADEKKDHVCFKRLDSNKDGLVTFQEFEKFYGNEEAKFHEADKDKDGKLTHDEYHDILGHGSL
ncbi:MAG: EF-hand domain-containing protein [Desulfobacterales bacterium]|jgi:Ca2+-binding EF-hand superfamily protein